MTLDPGHFDGAFVRAPDDKFEFVWSGRANDLNGPAYVAPAVRRFIGEDDASEVGRFVERFVHRDDREKAAAAWADAAGNQQRVDHELRLRRSDGQYRWFHASATPGREGAAFTVRAFDIDERRLMELRLGLLVRAGEMFHRSLDLPATLDNIARLAVESFCDFCVFDLIDECSSRLYVTASAHRDPAFDALGRTVGEILYDDEWRPHPVLFVSRTGMSAFVPSIEDATIETHAASRRHADFMRRLGYRSKMAVPVGARGEVFGVLTFVLTGTDRRFDSGDLAFAEELGRRAGVAVANAKQYRRERHVAETLQRAFLTDEFPAWPNLAFHGLYRPGEHDAEIGGDWYDAFETKAGEIVVAVGDVAGKGVDAARVMVRLRQSIRVAAAVTANPAKILAIVNEVLTTDSDEIMATAFVGVFGKKLDRLRYASAGHVPPFVRSRDGSVSRLEDPSPPLGISAATAFESHARGIGSGSLLVLYTDGVCEAGRDAIAGEQMLTEVLASDAIAHAVDPARYLERTLGTNVPHDDIAIMTVRFGSTEPQWLFAASDPRAAYAVKSEFARSIRSLCEAPEDDLLACELIFSEVIGNAVRYAPGPLSLALSVDGDQAVLHIIDHGPGFDYEPSLPKDIWSESGRGLFLVAAMARDLLIERLPGFGSYLRVTLPASYAPPASAA